MVKSPKVEFLGPRFAPILCALNWENGSRESGVRMSRTRTWIGLALAMLTLASVSLPQTQPKPQHTRHTKKPASKPLVLPPLPKGPLPQLPMDLMPSTTPKVGFQGGLLTIVAQNSTLGDILREVRKLTGASIDMPSNVTERVVTRLGPGAPRDVIASLLNGSTFNYVMVGSPNDPSAVTSVVLTAKPSGPQPQTVANASQPGVPPAQPQPFIVQRVPPQAGAQPPSATPDDAANASEDQETAADDNADQDQTDASGTVQPEQQPPGQPPNAGPKTPEQILEMLRRQQQQPPTAIPPNPQQPPEN